MNAVNKMCRKWAVENICSEQQDNRGMKKCEALPHRGTPFLIAAVLQVKTGPQRLAFSVMQTEIISTGILEHPCGLTAADGGPGGAGEPRGEPGSRGDPGRASRGAGERRRPELTRVLTRGQRRRRGRACCAGP